MDIPFKLNFLKQIEIYQDLKELDKEFLKQLRRCGTPCKTPPLWFFEKKILYWAGIKHKHLGSPLKLSYFDTEKSYDYIHKNSFEKIADDIKTEIPVIEKNLKDINCTFDEIKAVQIRKVFGNLEVRGLAKFFKESQENYWNINQSNCDGIFLTPKGLEYARMIYFLYKYNKAEDEYKRIEGIEKVLEIKLWQEVKFTAHITVSMLIIIGSIFLFFETLIPEIARLFN